MSDYFGLDPTQLGRGMSVRRYALAAFILIIAAAAAGFLVFRSTLDKTPLDRTVYVTAQAPAKTVPRTTLRNVVPRDVNFTIEAATKPAKTFSRRLEPGAVDSLAMDIPVEIVFFNGVRTVRQTVYPDRPYSFRLDESEHVKIYPGSHGREDEADLAPFVPTPMEVVEKMLDTAAVTRDDVLYDIGCGDGRVVIAAARLRGARGVGIDIDPDLIEESRREARRQGVDGLTRFIRMDATQARFAEATVVAVYLLPESLELLRHKFETELRPGARIVSHSYLIPGWEDKLVRTELFDDAGGKSRKIHLYIR
ncbi:MAG: class I SAM-dependent methyltransferase [Acidobacteriota bacterium]|nr:class I SAM-dependent methyltransferase [Acidobacteriota bacterium]